MNNVLNFSSINIADECFKKASKKISNFSLMMFFYKAGKYRKAINLFDKAADVYKSGKRFDRAGEAYTEAAKCCSEIGKLMDSVNYYADAFQCYKKCDMNRANECIKMAIVTYNLFNKNCPKETGGNDLNDQIIIESNNNYDSLRWYSTLEFSENTIRKSHFFNPKYQHQQSLLIKMADLYIRLKKYDKAAELYNKVAYEYNNNNTNDNGINEYLLNSLFCYLACGDIVLTQKIMETYYSVFNPFSSSNEYIFIANVLDAIINKNRNDFGQTISKYSQKLKFRDWHYAVLLSTKQQIFQ